MPTDLKERILAAADTPHALAPEEAMAAFEELLEALEAGVVRAASPGPDGLWRSNAWVKQGILLGFRLGRLEAFPGEPLAFVDKHTYPPRRFGVEEGVRVVPGGSAVRRGAHLAAGVVCMPPMYVNVGAYVGAGTMVDSHALVGSCAQIGARVHLSAAAQIGGVLEPVGATPVVVEDDVFVGGGCGVYEGCRVGARAVLAPGVILSASTRIYDLVREVIIAASEAGPPAIPAGAVVVPGVRAARGAFAEQHGLGLYAPVIVKYRDARTDAATTLEEALR